MASNPSSSDSPSAAPVPAAPSDAPAPVSLNAIIQTVLIVLALFVLIPGIDLAVSRLFYDPNWVDPSRNFFYRQAFLPNVLQNAAQAVGLAAGFGFAFAFLYAILTKSRPFGFNSRALGFLFVAFLLGPAILANVVLKDHWHRARPASIEQFGGVKKFTPALWISDQCDHNCSFVAGDPSVVFFFHSFAYVVPNRRRQRQILGASLAGGLLVGLSRIVVGAHFLSDVLFAGAVIVFASAAVHALLYGGSATAEAWKRWLGLSRDEAPPTDADRTTPVVVN